MFITQEWQDARVKIPEEMFEYGDDSITLPSNFLEYLWQPDLYFLNSKVIGKIKFIKTPNTSDQILSYVASHDVCHVAW